MASNDAAPEAKLSKTPLYIDLFAAHAMLVASLGTITSVSGERPRTPDNSMQAIYTIPVFLILSLVSGFLLWRRILQHRALRIVCWFLIGFAVLAIPITLVALNRSNGS